MHSYYVSGHRAATYFPLDLPECNRCLAAYERGRLSDIEAFRLSGSEWLVRAVEGEEFRGLMSKKQCFGSPLKAGKFPPAVMVAHRSGEFAIRMFAAVSPRLLEPPYREATISQVRPRALYSDLRNRIGGRELILGDAIDLGALQ